MEEKTNHMNVQAHRHGDEKPEAEQRAEKLRAAVEAAHEAVFGAASGSPLVGAKRELDGEPITPAYPYKEVCCNLQHEQY